MTTPEGELIYDGQPHTPEWFAVRREGITGTDLPKILSISKYGNALSVWQDKRGEVDDEAGEAAYWGTVLEDPVAQRWAWIHETTVTEVGVIANRDRRWIRASLDRLVAKCPDGDGPCGLEVKTRSAFKAGSWRDDVPDDVLAQVEWGLISTGLDHMHVAVLIGGQRLLWHRIDRDPALEQYLVEQAEPIWQSVLEGNPPEVSADAEGLLLAQLNEMHENRSGRVDLPPEASTHVESYRTASGEEGAAKKVKEQAKAELVRLLGDGDEAALNDVPVFTYRAPAPRDQVTADDLGLLKATNPELYDALRDEGLISTNEPRPRFNMRRTK